MRYVADLAEADIAKALGISRSTVSSTLTDAHRRSPMPTAHSSSV